MRKRLHPVFLYFCIRKKYRKTEMELAERKERQRQLMEAAEKRRELAAMFRRTLIDEIEAFAKLNPDEKKQEAKFYEVFAHNEGEMLTHFDNDRMYGPKTGITREQRWLRAAAFKLDPPQVIWDIMQKNEAHRVKIYNP